MIQFFKNLFGCVVKFLSYRRPPPATPEEADENYRWDSTK